VTSEQAVKMLRKGAAIVAGSVVVAVGWLGLRQYRKHQDCERRSAALARQIEAIRTDAWVQLKVGTKKADVARFFTEHGIPSAISESEASGTLFTSGCAPLGCGSDSALIGVRVKLDVSGSVVELPTVVSLYTSCL
jgi:hypothetical protein